MEIKLEIQKFDGDIVCPKCLYRDGAQATGMELSHLDGENVLIVICKRCGYGFLMFDAEAE